MWLEVYFGMILVNSIACILPFILIAWLCLLLTNESDSRESALDLLGLILFLGSFLLTASVLSFSFWTLEPYWICLILPGVLTAVLAWLICYTRRKKRRSS